MRNIFVALACMRTREVTTRRRAARHCRAARGCPAEWVLEGAIFVTCSPRLKGGGFSLQHRGQRRGSTRGLPGPEDVSGRVRVAVQHQSTGGADVSPHAEALGY